MKNLIIRKGVVRGKSVVLESETGLPDGQPVLLGIGAADGETEPTAEEVVQELEAEQTLQTIYQMRHSKKPFGQTKELVNLRGVWAEKAPSDLDIDKALKEIRSEWEEDLGDMMRE